MSVRLNMAVRRRCHVRRRADERLRDVVDAELQRAVQIREILLSQRRHGERHAGHVDALVRLDYASRDHAAEGSAVVHSLHAQPDVAVVDEDVVLGSEHRAEHRRSDREVVGAH